SDLQPVVVVLRRRTLEHQDHLPGVDVEDPHPTLPGRPAVVEGVDPLDLDEVAEHVVLGLLYLVVGELGQAGLDALTQDVEILGDDVLVELAHPGGEVGVRRFLGSEHDSLAVAVQVVLVPVPGVAEGEPAERVLVRADTGEPGAALARRLRHCVASCVVGVERTGGAGTSVNGVAPLSWSWSAKWHAARWFPPTSRSCGVSFLQISWA